MCVQCFLHEQNISRIVLGQKDMYHVLLPLQGVLKYAQPSDTILDVTNNSAEYTNSLWDRERSVSPSLFFSSYRRRDCDPGVQDVVYRFPRDMVYRQSLIVLPQVESEQTEATQRQQGPGAARTGGR
jgi:hypothetical protein